MNTGGNDDFGTLLRRYRRRGQLTQTALSGLSTVSVRAIRNLERGQVGLPRRDTVRLLADALRLTAQERVAFERAAGAEADDTLFHTLTMPATATTRPLLGRRSELDTLLRHVVSGHTRITSITGFAGGGKTRLALAVARALHGSHGMPVLWETVRTDDGRDAGPYPDGTPGGEPGGRIRHLVLCARPQVPVRGATDPLDRLVRLIGDRPVLLVLDGNDAGQVSRPTMWTLIRQCPRLRILETTRTPHGTPEEYQLALGPLAVPAADGRPREIIGAPAMALLLEHITDLQPGFTPDPATLPVLAEICRRLDGLPRALEAAASWFAIVSPDELVTMARGEPHLLATRPGDHPDAAATVRDAVMAQPRPYRGLLVRLADWSGPWTVEKVVSRMGIPRGQAGRAVHAFLQRGLIMKVAAGPDSRVRFAVLNIVRAFLREAPDAVA